jgi:hypothetical protein
VKSAIVNFYFPEKPELTPGQNFIPAFSPLKATYAGIFNEG